MTRLQSMTTTEITSFGFTNPSGGTGMSNWRFNAKFTKATAKVRVVKAWDDYETGLRFIGISDDPDLTQYLSTVTASDDDKTVYFSEYELSDPKEAKKLMERFCDEVGEVRTSDGYAFRKDESGKWTDGDMTFDSLAHLMEEADLVVDIDFSQKKVASNQERNRQG